MAKPQGRWTSSPPPDGFWFHRASDSEPPQLLRVYKREVFMCFPDHCWPVDTFDGEWWSEEVLPSPACIAYLGGNATPESVAKSALWPGPRKKRKS